MYKSSWKSPSNIALVKYWGKKYPQLPMNPSISFTLKNSVTTMNVEVSESSNLEVEFNFENKKNVKFEDKINKLLQDFSRDFKWINSFKFNINSSNTFPHSSGIASSASSMSAFVLCLLSLNEQITGEKWDKSKASYYSRLASGSASRSVFPIISFWEGEQASELLDVDPIFKTYCDTIVIVDKNEKSVSSRAGHDLMINHPYRDARYREAYNNIEILKDALKNGDLNSFIQVVEEEALSLHALMMTSRPSYILLKPESLSVIDKVRKIREEKKIPVCFTIDAGPNIHILYPKNYQDIIKIEFASFNCIHDEVGSGPEKIV